MRRYKATTTDGEEFFVLATEHHEAAQYASDEARDRDLELRDVALMPEKYGFELYD